MTTKRGFRAKGKVSDCSKMSGKETGCPPSGPSKVEGFTLIELMVVLVVIAVLLAIAIPTFLGSRNTADARSTQSNVRSAVAAEQSYWTSHQVFADSLDATEPSLSWQTNIKKLTPGTNTVYTDVYTATVSGGAISSWKAGGTGLGGVLIGGLGKDGQCYFAFRSNNPAGSFTAYYQTPAAAAQCKAPAAGKLPTTAASSGTSAASSAGTWASTF